MDLETLQLIVNKWFSEQKTLPANTQVDIIISLKSKRVKVSTKAATGSRLTLEEFLTHEKMMAGGETRRYKVSRIINALKFYMPQLLGTNDWQRVTLKEFREKVDRHKLVTETHQRFGSTSLSVLNQILAYYGCKTY